MPLRRGRRYGRAARGQSHGPEHVCDETWEEATPNDEDADGLECRIEFDGCSDGLMYEFVCRDGECDCVADGDKLGGFDAAETFTASCPRQIAELKVLCGWNLPNGRERAVPER